MKAESLLFTIAAWIFVKQLWLIRLRESIIWKCWNQTHFHHKREQKAHKSEDYALDGMLHFCSHLWWNRAQSKSNQNTFFLCNNRDGIKSNLPLSTPLHEHFTNAWMLRKKTSRWWRVRDAPLLSANPLYGTSFHWELLWVVWTN